MKITDFTMGTEDRRGATFALCDFDDVIWRRVSEPELNLAVRPNYTDSKRISFHLIELWFAQYEPKQVVEVA